MRQTVPNSYHKDTECLHDREFVNVAYFLPTASASASASVTASAESASALLTVGSSPPPSTS